MLKIKKYNQILYIFFLINYELSIDPKLQNNNSIDKEAFISLINKELSSNNNLSKDEKTFFSSIRNDLLKNKELPIDENVLKSLVFINFLKNNQLATDEDSLDQKNSKKQMRMFNIIFFLIFVFVFICIFLFTNNKEKEIYSVFNYSLKIPQLKIDFIFSDNFDSLDYTSFQNYWIKSNDENSLKMALYSEQYLKDNRLPSNNKNIKTIINIENYKLVYEKISGAFLLRYKDDEKKKQVSDACVALIKPRIKEYIEIAKKNKALSKED
jgi:hypothetical protein